MFILQVSRPASHYSPNLLLRKLNTSHTLIWSVDWLKIAAGFFAVVDPNDSGSILYLTDIEYKEYWKVASSNRLALLVLARPGEKMPPSESITATKPPKFPLLQHFRKGRVYSRILKLLWGSLWERGLVVPMDRNIRIILGAWSSTLRLWTGITSRSPQLDKDSLDVTYHLLRILKHNGSMGLALYLKVSLIIMNKYLAGEPLSTSWPLKFAIRLSSGLPSWFPLRVRTAIRQGSPSTIRVWASILYSYKALYALGSYSVKTITAPALDTRHPAVEQLLTEFQWFCGYHVEREGWDKIPFMVNPDHKTPPLSRKSGPNGPATINSHWDAFLLSSTEEGKRLWELICSILHEIGVPIFTSTIVKTHKDLLDLAKKYIRDPSSKSSERKVKRVGSLSRIAFIPEAAGKVRTIGILDYFSQWVLKPLHTYLFSILKKIPQDGTYDQSSAFLTFLQETKDAKGTYSSLDISSATDLIPYQLYEVLLNCLFNPLTASGKLGTMYLQLMRDRDFKVTPAIAGKPSTISPRSKATPEEILGEHGTPPRKPGEKGWMAQRELVPLIQKAISKTRNSCVALPAMVRYTRGQPMGAYGSFGLLGLIHHLLIQYAALRVGQYPFLTYRVLGDDSVFFETEHHAGKVSEQYLVLCEILGIPINLHKSYVGKDFFTFASRTAHKGLEVTPASLKGEISVNSTGRRVEFAFSLLSKGWTLDGSKSSHQKWLTRFIRLLTEPVQYFFGMKLVSTQGLLGTIISRLVSVALLPRYSNMEKLGLKYPPVKAWLASLRGSASILAKQVSITDNSFEGIHFDNEYTYSSYLLCRFLQKRLVLAVIQSSLLSKKLHDTDEVSYSESVTAIIQRSYFSFLANTQVLTNTEISKLLGIYDIMSYVPENQRESIVPDRWYLTKEQMNQLTLYPMPMTGTIETPSRMGVSVLHGELMTRYHGKPWITLSQFYEDILVQLVNVMLSFRSVLDWTVEANLRPDNQLESYVFKDESGSLDFIHASMISMFYKSPTFNVPTDGNLLSGKRERSLDRPLSK